jgi:hypothetical protein
MNKPYQRKEVSVTVHEALMQIGSLAAEFISQPETWPRGIRKLAQRCHRATSRAATGPFARRDLLENYTIVITSLYLSPLSPHHCSRRSDPEKTGDTPPVTGCHHCHRNPRGTLGNDHYPDHVRLDHSRSHSR